LLVLDNCEHLVVACASLAADLLRSCPDIHILASSREPLNVAGEQTYRVPSLPDPKQVQTVESLSQIRGGAGTVVVGGGDQHAAGPPVPPADGRCAQYAPPAADLAGAD